MDENQKGYLKENKKTIGSISLHSFHTPILTQDELQEFQARLKNAHSLPEMLFHSGLNVSIEGNDDPIISFNSFDSLQMALLDHKEREGLKNVKVKSSWTSKQTTKDSKKILCDDSGGQKEVTIKVRDDNMDWTFSNLYRGSVHPDCTITDTTEEIDYESLMKPEEILFYDHIVLFEDELHDHGTARCTVKIRAMKNHMFILLRFFLRVDNVLVRIIDSRYYHVFGKNYFVREFSHYECDIPDLEKRLGPIFAKDTEFMDSPDKLRPKMPMLKKTNEKISLK